MAYLKSLKLVLIFIGISLISSSIWFNYRFIRRFFTDKKNPIQRVLFYPSLIFFIFCILSLSAILSQVIMNELLITQIFSGGFYGLQLYALLIVLIIRLYLVFKGTKFKLSQLTLNIYKILFVLTFLMIITIIPTILYLNSKLIFTIFTLMLIHAIFMNLSLSVLFVVKLNQINNHQSKLFDIWTKNTILAIISNMMTLFVIFGFILSILINDPNNYWIFSFNVIVQLFDIYTNYVCIALSFQCFQDKYLKICGCLDRRFKTLYTKIIYNNNKQDNLDQSDPKNKSDTMTSLEIIVSEKEKEKEKTNESDDDNDNDDDEDFVFCPKNTFSESFMIYCGIYCCIFIVKLTIFIVVLIRLIGTIYI